MIKQQLKAHEVLPSPYSILLSIHLSLCHSLTLALAAAAAAAAIVAAAAVNDSNKVEAAFLYLLFFCRVVSAVSFYLLLACLRSRSALLLRL